MASGSLSLSGVPLGMPFAHPIVMTHPSGSSNVFPASQSGTAPSTPMTTIYRSSTVPSHQPTPISIASNTGSTALAAERHPSWDGQALVFLHRFFGRLSTCGKSTDRSFWDSFVQEFFTKKGRISIILRSAVTRETERFVIHDALLPKFFHTQYQSGIESVQMTLQAAIVYLVNNGMSVECPQASMLHHYGNGVIIILKGHLSVQCVYEADATTTNGVNHKLKIESLHFSCNEQQEFVERSQLLANRHIVLPESPINHWGIPPRLYELLKLLQVPPTFGEIVRESIISGATARECLEKRSLGSRKDTTMSLPQNQQQYQQQQQLQFQRQMQLLLQQQQQQQQHQHQQRQLQEMALALSSQGVQPYGQLWPHSQNTQPNAAMATARSPSYPAHSPISLPLAHQSPIDTHGNVVIKGESPATPKITSTTLAS